VEEMLLVAIKTSDILLILEVFPADDALLFTMEESSSELVLIDRLEHPDLVVVVVESVDIHEHVVLDQILKHHNPVENDKDSDHAETKHNNV
jgi:hypothetical protein